MGVVEKSDLVVKLSDTTDNRSEQKWIISHRCGDNTLVVVIATQAIKWHENRRTDKGAHFTIWKRRYLETCL